MTAIVCTYFDREKQLIKTLSTFFKYDPKEFFVVIMDDQSPSELALPQMPFEVFPLRASGKNWSQNDASWNKAIYFAMLKNPDVIMLQNAECFHVGNVLGYVKENLKSDNYLSFACFSLSMANTFDPKIGGRLHEVIAEHNVCATDSEHDSWYNHPAYRGTGYHFCSAITAENMRKLNGFDERYMLGVGYDDDDLVMRIKRLGLRIDFPTDPFVVHQWHKHGNAPSHLMEKNRDLYESIAREEKGYKAHHLITDDL